MCLERNERGEGGGKDIEWGQWTTEVIQDLVGLILSKKMSLLAAGVKGSKDGTPKNNS